MKILFVFFVSVFALLLGSCAEMPLMSDEEYYSRKGPAPHSPDPTMQIPQPSSSRRGY